MPRSHAQQGFVLPMTLIILALLTTLSMGLSQMARHAIADVQHRQAVFDQELLMKSAAQRALYYLLIGVPKPRTFVSNDFTLAVDGQWQSWDDVKISIQDAAGLMGLAMYNQSAFERLLTTYLSQSDATTIAAQLGDWMDEDSFTRPYGMETNDYLKASMPMLPRDGLLRSLDGLLELPAITPELFNATDRADGVDGVLGLRDLLLAGGADYFNPATAPDILMLPMLGGANNKSILSLKKKHDWASMKKLFPSRAGFDVEYSPAYTFVFRFRSAGMTGRAMYRLAPAKTVPYQLIMWQYPDHVRG
ncbi:general secretion pathway protein GspK [Mariprofundus ferrooxydans]|nr:general secretion pathway protein GspK [Mariprofundus ferrooxydans]MBN4077141.1 general secretion pathway protein GspK [Mariprofundus ferrooxydans]